MYITIKTMKQNQPKQDTLYLDLQIYNIILVYTIQSA